MTIFALGEREPGNALAAATESITYNPLIVVPLLTLLCEIAV